MTDTASDTLTRYAWARNAEQAARYASYHIGALSSYATVAEAVARRDSEPDGDTTLYRVTAETVDVPEPEPQEEARWWLVLFTAEGWDVETTNVTAATVQAFHGSDTEYLAWVYCHRPDAEQCAINAWREAGFSKAPQAFGEPEPEPTWWWARGLVWNTIIVTENQSGINQQRASINSPNTGSPPFDAVVPAITKDGALDGAREMWSDLAAQIGGEG